MIRSFTTADFLTLANGACGLAAILLAFRHAETHLDRELYIAAALMVVALVFDFADGRVARWRGESSSFGRELDSLADIISFGAAPAAIAFAAGFNSALDTVLLVFFALCSLS